MTRVEIKKKFDEIVNFAGVERYVDTPVKRYSSGMSVRLAFSVAAHLESEILIVDEVLAVGDAEFQKKCFGLMNSMNKEKAKTVLIVSHQLNQIKSVCNKTLMLQNGKVYGIGETDDILKKYLEFGKKTGSWSNEENKVYNRIVNPLKISFNNTEGTSKTIFSGNEVIQLQLEFEVTELLPELVVGFALYTSDGSLLFWTTQKDTHPEGWPPLELGVNKLQFTIPQRILNEGAYFVEFFSAIHYREWLTPPDGNGPRADFEIKGELSDSPSWQNKRPGLIAPVIQSIQIK
jgi:lipopolysaccharide transport system ATP-binding protein